MMQPTLKAPKPIYGLNLLRIDSNHIVRCSDGMSRQYTVRDLAKHPKCNRVVVCLKCGKTYASKEELFEQHPEHKVMQNNEETHSWAYWSEDPVLAGKAEEKETKGAPKIVDYARILGLLSDGERMRD